VTDGNDRAETWKPVPNASRYEVSDKGRVRRGDRILAQSVKNGYLQVKYTDDTGKRRDALVHRLVLLAFEGPCPPGKETCHSKAGPLFNWWPEGVRWDTHPANEAEKDEPPQLPEFPCKDGCGALVAREGRRCGDCSALAGRKIARMLEAGMNLAVAAERFGLGPEWAYKIAVKDGGYGGAKRHAGLQRPSLTQRARITLRDRQRDGWGDGATGAGDVA
jgi:hypothetical protein